MQKPTIVVLEGDETIRRKVQGLLLRSGYAVVASSDTADILQTLHDTSPALVIVGSAQAGSAHSIEIAQRIRCWDRTLPVILLVPHSSEELAIAALKAGVRDYFKLPFSRTAFMASVHNCLAGTLPQASQDAPVADTTRRDNGPRVIGVSPSIQHIKAYLDRVAVMDSNVLITGETGTGKELAAELIHCRSQRCRQPFIRLNCAAIPDSLLESELFGYERGAFTGANAPREGALQLAAGGTVLLDEIGDMSPFAQAKILRAIDNKEAQRLGGKRSVPLDIRVVAATNQDLEQLVSAGGFRQDLYFRLNVVRVHLPPLRDRQEDILPLLAHYVQDANRRFMRQVEDFTEEACTCLLRYRWPGNVRELKNLVEAAFINLPARRIAFIDLPEPFRRQCRAAEDLPPDERARLLRALFTTNWNKSQAAQQLHWSRMTLYRKMAKYRIVNEGKAVGDRQAAGAVVTSSSAMFQPVAH